MVAPETASKYSPPDRGWPRDGGTMHMLGLLLLIPTLLYIWPRTAVIGAILITGYLGGAIATHLRLGSQLFRHIFFGASLVVLFLAGLWILSHSFGWLVTPRLAGSLFPGKHA